eukprot:CAMPEP_0194762718 /NCGR_PEP_ID=MMETSP0323_2-20130528/16744_1 /TAXON_ID=2866 ORGANISM="Crypthecodinium cohnii, Strain Seligo" /NCGR_SAMPLE_ID=MMETSP0323_2 /ASSEMBLY_ACC=CAM_ASM_000346 /LENGTH=64 /DNA_ID=CAMNT_0039685727 /DNA_START=61 /DNA_END=256 /DNA_ORIENTATION=+
MTKVNLVLSAVCAWLLLPSASSGASDSAASLSSPRLSPSAAMFPVSSMQLASSASTDIEEARPT